jgi:hypothetical protein
MTNTTREEIAARDERRAAFLKMLSEGVVASDRVLANEALNRAMVGFMASKGKDDNGPYLREDLERVCGKDSSVMKLVIEAEFAIAAARVLERERCARIAEDFGTTAAIGLGPSIARKIRSGENR